jgi:site-specific DNA-methyltransferase (adenine-specific)
MRSVDIGGNVFYHGDCRAGAARYLEDESVDLIITDPPYGIDGDQLHRHYNRDEGYVVDGYVEVPQKEYAAFSREWIGEAERVLKPGGSVYVVSGYTNLVHILTALRDAGLREVNHVIWKYTFGVFTRRKFVSSHYHVLYYEKPGAKRTFHLESRFGTCERSGDGGSLNYRDREDVWEINREYKPGRVKNKNELPYQLLVKMLQYSSSEGDLVCDFFLGGFSTAVAAIGLNRRATGFELSGRAFDSGTGKLRTVEPGFLVPGLRDPELDAPANRGMRWTEKACDDLFADYQRMKAAGVQRKDIIRDLSRSYGRGRWAVEKALKKRENGEKSDSST